MPIIDINHSDKILYIVAGCNGAGKSTAFRNLLSKQLDNPVFINADDIARDMCPENVESVAFAAGRIMLTQVDEQLKKDESFCIETTLSTKSYTNLVNKAHNNGFKVALFYYWLESPELAIARVAQRVAEGGHNIPEDIIRRRYSRGIYNLMHLFIKNVDYWKIINNSGLVPQDIAKGAIEISNAQQFDYLAHYEK